MQDRTPLPRDQRPPIPEFTPVPRRRKRHDGWTPARQRAFIEALADTGSVKAAARRVNMAPEGAYQLRRQPEAGEFAAAWDAALDCGIQNLADIAIQRAVEGVPVPIFWRGEQVGEKRWFNDRLLMFILRHHLPQRYGALKPLPEGTKSPETRKREVAWSMAPSGHDPRADWSEEEWQAYGQWLDKILKRYALKARQEREYRLAGEIVAADYTLRQLTHIELILDLGGKSQAMLKLLTNARNPDGTPGAELWASPISQELDRIRRKIWREMGEPDRPPLPLDRRTCLHGETWGGPTQQEREQARRAAEARMAEAQQEWEAAASEETWETWKAGAIGRRGEC